MCLLLTRQIAQVALDRFDDEPPLRLLPHFAQRSELVADFRGQPEADLRIVLDSRAAIAGGWASNSSVRQFALRAVRRSH